MTHRDAVVGFCLRRAPRAEALEASAETFAVAWRRRNDTPGADTILPWLYAIAHRVLANQRRGSRRLSSLRAKLTGAQLPNPTTEPAEIVLRTEDERDLLEAFSRLRPADQEILRLVTWEELPREHVAEMLAISRAALDQRLHRAAIRLRKEYGRADDIEVGSHRPIEGSAM